jgi:ATP-dependent Clp protease adaptor protein ClpS
MSNARLYGMSKKPSQTKKGRYEVVVVNDNVNTFEHVINCLIEVCNHNYYQAGQCATIIHNKGECSVFVDTHKECTSVCEELLDLNLNVILQKHKTSTDVTKD